MPSWYKLSKIYIWNTKVRPNNELVYDFTSINNMTFLWRQNGYTWYGWTSWSWYYSAVQSGSYYRTDTVWKFPDEAYTKWTPKVFKIEMDVPNTNSWAWLCYGAGETSNYNHRWRWLGCWNSVSLNQMTLPWPSYQSYTYSTGIQTLVIDLEEKKMYVEWNNSTPITLSDTYITNIRTYWANKDIYINIVANSYPVTTYVRKCTIEF